jgi:hypothetical protein
MADLRIVELLTPHKYHTWKINIQSLLQSKGLWKMLVEAQVVLTKEIERFAYQNKFDESMGIISLHVLDGLLFHIVECTTPK